MIKRKSPPTDRGGLTVGTNQVVCECNRETTNKGEKLMRYSNLGIARADCKPPSAAIIVSNLLPWASELPMS